MSTDFQTWAIQNIKRFLEPLLNGADNKENLYRLLIRLGWEPSLLPANVISEFKNPITIIKNTSELLSTEPSTLEELLKTINAVNELIATFDKFSKPFSRLTLNPPLNPTEFITDLFSLLLVEYLYKDYPDLFFALVLLDIIKPSQNTGTFLDQTTQCLVRLSPKIPRVEISSIANLLWNPIGTLQQAYLPLGSLPDVGAAKGFSDRLFPRLAFFLSSLGFDFHYGLTEADKDGFPSDDIAFEQANRTLYLHYDITPKTKANIEFLILPKSEDGPALKIGAKGIFDLEHTVEAWLFQINAGGEFPSLQIGSEGVTVVDGAKQAKINGSATRLSFTDEPVLLLGSRTETRLEIGLFRIDAYFNAKDPDLDFGLGFYAGNCAFILDSSNTDNFLKKVLPPKGIRANFNLGFSWSYRYGFQLCGNLGLETDLPLYLSIGDAIKLESLYLVLRGESDSLVVATGLSTVLKLGPVTASVQRVGLQATYGFGNSPAKGFHFGFLPPTGVGLAINASGITGGGFIDFDEPNQRYFGALALNFSEIGLTAIGLIETKLPDGSEGFALIISIGITFTPPVQLSLGFTLLGVGGLIAVNRSLNIEALQAGIKNRTLDGILFPDPSTLVANAPKIISDLQAVFPVQEGRFVVGPIVKIGWGSPTLLTADIGIFLELPDPIRIVLMGQVEATFPKPDKALVVIHLDVLGVIDVAKQELSFQASLYDSGILSFTLSGDGAFLLGWGDNPRFALSLGGFHPKFTPPPPAIIFAGLKRLSLDLGLSGKLQLACLAYLAPTPNTLQFGAHVNLHVSAGPLTVDGHLGFDALFILCPFGFDVEIRGGVHLKFGRISLFEISLTLVLSGPTPWHARGKAKIKLLFFSISVGFSFTWGQEEKVSLPPIDPWKPFCDALKDAGNWGSLLPAGRGMVEALRSLEAEAAKAIVVHPAGRLEVRQNIVPLGITLTKMGIAPISTHDRFDIESLTVGSETLKNLEPIEEFFARGQFEELTNDQKLSLPSFEKMKAGVRAAASEMVCIDGQPEDKTLTYESILINPDRSSELKTTAGHFVWEDAQFIVAASVARRVEQRMGPQKRFSDLRPQPKVTVGEERYAIANTANLTRAQLAGQNNLNLSRMEAEQILKAQLERQPALANQLIAIPEAEVAK